MSAKLRHESFLFELPFDAGVQPGFMLHSKDDRDAPREPEWKDFDLQQYLGFEGTLVPGEMVSTTLTFRVAERRGKPFYFARRAWPEVFASNRWQGSRFERLLATRAAQALLELALNSSVERHAVVQATRLAPQPGVANDEWRFGQLLAALENLNGFLIGVGAILEHPEVSPVAVQELPSIVPGWGWDLAPDGSRSSIEWRTYLAHERHPSSPIEPLSQPETELAMWLSAFPEHPLMPPGEFILNAMQSAHRGRVVHAVIEAGTAIELLISGSLRVAGSPKGYDATKLGNILNGSFASQAKDHFAVIFGFDRDPKTSSDELGEWWQQCYLLRNKVVHQGYRPSREEVHQAIEASLKLHNETGRRLTADATIKPHLLPIPEQAFDAAAKARAKRQEQSI